MVKAITGEHAITTILSLKLGNCKKMRANTASTGKICARAFQQGPKFCKHFRNLEDHLYPLLLEEITTKL